MSDTFTYRGGHLVCEERDAADIAREVGTPCYVYSRQAIEGNYLALAHAFAPAAPLICYSVKANSNLSILRLLRDLGAGFDIVSGGELYRAQAAGADPAKIVFAGVGKTRAEIRQALEAGVLMLNVESEPELAAINREAADRRVQARVALRLNPDIDPKTHRHITTGKKETKFGIDLESARNLVARVAEWPHVRLVGYHAHIGSQVTDPKPHAASLGKLIAFATDCVPANSAIEWVNIGGGFGIDYVPGQAPPPSAFAELLLPMLAAAPKRLKLIMEPGRFIVGNAGVLLTRVVYVKRNRDGRRFVICDAAMNDLIRPALYDAHHRVWPVESDQPFASDGFSPADIVGPVCESGDYFAKDRPLPEVAEGDLLAVFGAGAYGFAMSSNYNSRPRACEVVVDGRQIRVARRRETYEDLVRQETL
ncbi:MAG TPA: diaminopimelate decarboxylase [Planctomycetota bacterium]|nr:diaminopimelate decarboxylase [Planctomycetota bacterium]HRR79736.1 diaminopimelate decarboxylase [Planctomycetota bacterium]HRT96392.1 diaminopimelate decarboxylase [Planctomycetota bacterium]